MQKKKKMFITIACALCITSLQIGSCWATLIGSHSRIFDLMQIFTGQVTSFSFTPFYSLYHVADQDSSAVLPFGTITLDQSDWGATGLIYNADSSAPDFMTAVSYLTNGSNNVLGEIINNNSSQFLSFGPSESNLLTGIGFTNPDFHGTAITAMILTIDTVSASNLTYHVDYYDNNPGPTPTPEPATLLLFGTGLVGLIAAKLKKD